MVEAMVDGLLKNATDERARERLLANTTKESGAWLNAFPIASCALHMDNESVCVAIGLRLDAPLCHPRTCHHCGTKVDELATHGLSCCWSEGGLPWHAAVNDIIC